MNEFPLRGLCIGLFMRVFLACHITCHICDETLPAAPSKYISPFIPEMCTRCVFCAGYAEVSH